MTSLLTRLTLEDYLALPETNVPTEVVDGVLVVNAFATPRHQRAASRLIVALHAALAGSDLEVYGPAEWLLRRDPVLARQPDIVVVPRTVADTNQLRLIEPPLLAIEILSADSVERDVVTKRREYFEVGLRHYWVVDPDEPAVVGFDASGEYAHAQAGDPFVVDTPIPFRVIPSDLVS